MNPPIWRGRPTHEDDEDESKELHAAEIAMRLDDEPGRSRVETVVYDTGSSVHIGRLGAVERTLRLVSSSVRRAFGRFQMNESRVDLVENRLVAIEGAVVLLVGFAVLIFCGAWTGAVVAAGTAYWLWGSGG